MKTKLELAHEYAMLHMMNPQYKDVDDLEVVQWAWDYVEAMQAEADKRNKAEAEKKRKEMREILNADNTFIEREGQHFDDVCSDEIQAQRDAELYGTGFLKVTYDSDGVKYERLNPKTISICSANMGFDSQVLKEWQPDWSQAPHGFDWWAMDECGTCTWFKEKPSIGGFLFTDEFIGGGDNGAVDAPSFNYSGNWRDSLRKRP